MWCHRQASAAHCSHCRWVIIHIAISSSANNLHTGAAATVDICYSSDSATGCHPQAIWRSGRYCSIAAWHCRCLSSDWRCDAAVLSSVGVWTLWFSCRSPALYWPVKWCYKRLAMCCSCWSIPIIAMMWLVFKTASSMNWPMWMQVCFVRTYEHFGFWNLRRWTLFNACKIEII